MPSNDEAAEAAHILEALRRIQRTLDHQERPLARACGLTEKMFLLLADAELIEVTHFADAGEVLDIHHIERILPKGHAILVLGPTEPLKVIVEPLQRSIWSRIYSAIAKGLWDVTKLAIAAGLGLLAGWILWKKHWK